MPHQHEPAYRDDLAYIHDAGFGRFAEAAAQELLARLRGAKHESGLVIELGCGSGILSERIAAAGYSVLGFDISAAMVALAKQRVPGGEFRHESFLTAKLPPCVAVAAVGEVFNYLFDRGHTDARLWKFFARVQQALLPGGLFQFDVAGPGRAGPTGRTHAATEQADWACLYAAEEDRNRRRLTREITTFRRVGELYRRDHETHRLRLYPAVEVVRQLKLSGFATRRLPGYAGLPMPAGWNTFLAIKKRAVPKRGIRDK
ncbi:MAG: class I SAM-dependent methyltransferase [Pirellulales bacterium]|nr:class I SAM-dependent methyltransferase [Pirellulales bacterium]